MTNTKKLNTKKDELNTLELNKCSLKTVWIIESYRTVWKQILVANFNLSEDNL